MVNKIILLLIKKIEVFTAANNWYSKTVKLLYSITWLKKKNEKLLSKAI